MRIKLRWKEVDLENLAIEKAKEDNERYIPKEYSNGDTPKQLLARSRHALAKKKVIGHLIRKIELKYYL